jgi:hypothetical protein
MLQIFTVDPTIPNPNSASDFFNPDIAPNELLNPFILTDHNRDPLDISYEVVEDASRMADGTLRKYVTANKKIISVNWNMVPAAGGKLYTSDGNLGAAWLKSFYEQNYNKPIWIKLSYAAENWSWNNANSTNNTYLNFNKITNTEATPYIVRRAFMGFVDDGVSEGYVITTAKNEITVANSPYIYINGVDQMFNGVWKLKKKGVGDDYNKLYFDFNKDGNPPARFHINSYNAAGNECTFNVDSTDFLRDGTNIIVSNTKSVEGGASNINGRWVVQRVINSNLFEAFSINYDFEVQVVGYTGSGHIDSSFQLLDKELNSLSPAVIGPAVSSDVMKVFMKDFTYTINKRFYTTDYVDMSIQFVEI